MKVLPNPYRGSGLPQQAGLAQGAVSADPTAPLTLLRLCPAAAATPLHSLSDLAARLGISRLWLKDESQRMGLGSFKALGAAYVIARDAAQAAVREIDNAGNAGTSPDYDTLKNVLNGRVYACASAGNHGLSVAMGCRLFGATAMIYLSEAVPQAFAERLQATGATVVRAGNNYEASMVAVADDAEKNDWMLLSDSSWPGYVDIPTRVMEGYLVMAAEIDEQLKAPPSHIVLQAGVGGLAAAMTAYFRKVWGDGPTIIVVEPESAAALHDSIVAAQPVTASGPVSIMGRLDCKAPSHLALTELARHADLFVTVSDEHSAQAVELLLQFGMSTTPSGAAGVAALMHGPELGIGSDSQVLAFMSEGEER